MKNVEIIQLEPRRLFTAIVVNDSSDFIWPPDGPVMTLRMAIGIANKSSDPTTITFDPSVQYINQSGSGFLVGGSQPITIIGPPSTVTIDDNAIGTAFFINGNVSLSNMKVVNTSAVSIYNLGNATLTLSNVNITSSNGLIQNFGIIYDAEPLSTVVANIKSGDIGLNGPNGMANGYLNLGNTIEIRYTLIGDTNLDGTVDFTDFMHMSQHFTQTGVGWAQGDFNYDGVVNDSDFQLLKPNYGLTDPPGYGLGALPGAIMAETETPQFNGYVAGDTVVATCDFFDGDATGSATIDTRGCTHTLIKKGTTDVIQSVSSNHHGGEQLNLVNHGRGWSNHVWRKQ